MECNLGEIEPGDLVVIGSNYGQDLGFFKGTGRGTLQYYSVSYLSNKFDNPKINWPVSYLGGGYATRRMTKYHPDLITDPIKRKELVKAINYIRETEILPIKY